MESQKNATGASMHPIVLLPCPFCGGKAKEYCSPTWKYDVYCDKCEIKFTRTSHIEAADAWNNRQRIRFRPQDMEREKAGCHARATQLAIIRERLAISSWERQRAVCSFPLMVAQVASDMQKVMDAQAYTERTTETVAMLEHYEAIIRDAYRTQFGRELGQ
jgi:hypothetical protein